MGKRTSRGYGYRDIRVIDTRARGNWYGSHEYRNRAMGKEWGCGLDKQSGQAGSQTKWTGRVPGKDSEVRWEVNRSYEH